MSRLNYSKWDHIEVSDDEDDTHPNIDTPSLFRWRHQARLERDAAWKKEKAEFENNYKSFLTKYNEAQQKLNKAKETGSDNIQELQKKLDELEVEAKEWSVKVTEIQKKERLRPLNIDTICKDAKSKTEEKQKRLGPGGLDPVEVFESLPTNLQECFEKKDVELLKTVLCSMDPQQAEYHMKRCVDSGLWVDNARDQQEEDGESSSNVNTDGNDDIAATIQTNKEPIHDNA
ncbi:hsp90 co-chaperone Cdc37, variant 3 [Schistosoma haematobium]|uniref:Hsp90 chaperone protein kinase-targeting subunit n=1 Tax=Schistosoma haematobium TaxID=6185 RepID=A0A922IJA0_SCHHA|nr:hsp90 co-chaperone Cdc37, variant 3 [Schistosoma haematobium]KAH9580842.1 hsp90 co-chaperone Cdc37, variant 3 [Schistosoma haematobium]